MNHDYHRLAERRHHAPHDVLGAHDNGDGTTTIRTVQCGAESVAVRINGGEPEPMAPAEEYPALFSTTVDYFVDTYVFEITWAGGTTTTLEDPYRRLPTVGDLDRYLCLLYTSDAADE